MARKKKKLTRKQLKQQRQEIVARKRQERGWTPPKPARSRRGRDEVIADLQPLLENGSLSSDDAGMEALMIMLLDSADLADEPELEEIFINPMLCVDVLVEVGEELGIGPSALDTLSDEGVDEDQQRDMLEITIQRVLTEEARQDIVDGLDNLRLRLKQSGTPKEVARVAAVQSFLRGDAGDEFLSMIGLVQAIVYRSLNAGFAMLEASADLMEVIDTDDVDTPLTFLQKLSQSELIQKAGGMLKKAPGLGGFLEKQADKVWDEGRKALYEGDLYLELFTEKELVTGFEIFKTTFTDDLDVDKLTPQTAATALTKEKMKTFIFRIKDHVIGLLTTERLEQLRAHLNGVLDDPDLPKKWAPFILMLLEYVADDAIEESKSLFFTFTFIGEFNAVSQITEDEE